MSRSAHGARDGPQDAHHTTSCCKRPSSNTHNQAPAPHLNLKSIDLVTAAAGGLRGERGDTSISLSSCCALNTRAASARAASRASRSARMA